MTGCAFLFPSHTDFKNVLVINEVPVVVALVVVFVVFLALPVVIVIDVLFSRYHIYESLEIPQGFIRKFVHKLELKYNNIPYHNAVHAYDVLCNSHVLMQTIDPCIHVERPELLKFALYIAAAGHDLG